MRWFTALRNALDLERRVAEVERKGEELAHSVDMVEMEWNDVLDKLKARDERERKRRRAAVAQEPDEAPAAPPLASGGTGKSELWARLRAQREAAAQRQAKGG